LNFGSDLQIFYKFRLARLRIWEYLALKPRLTNHETEKPSFALINRHPALLQLVGQCEQARLTGTAVTSGKGGSSRPIEATATSVDIHHGHLKLWFMAGNRKMTFEPAYYFAGKNTAAGRHRRLQLNLEQMKAGSAKAVIRIRSRT
jgi:hypothetical protein